MLDILLVTFSFLNVVNIFVLIYTVVYYRKLTKSLTSDISILNCRYHNAIRYTKERYGLDISNRI